jgi:sugar lactone lactonase YvrE
MEVIPLLDNREYQGYSPPGRLDWPADVERLPNGNTLITDAGYWSGQGSEILEVDLLGNIVWSYDKDLRFAHSAKLIQGEKILIADTTNNRILIVDRDGNIVFSSEEWGDGSGKLSDGSKLFYPNDAHLMTTGHFVITDRNNDRVIVVDELGEIIHSFSGLKHPHNGEVLANGNLLFANSDANMVQELDSKGNVVWSYGDGRSEILNWPRDADRLDNGNTLITDSKNHRVLEVTPGGEIAWLYQMEKRGHIYEADRLSNGNTLISAQQRYQVFEVDKAGNIVWSFRNFYRPQSLPEQLQNGSFETESYTGSKIPAYWFTCDLVSEGGVKFIWDEQVKHSGNRSVGIQYSHHGAVWWNQIVHVKPRTKYRVEVYVKTINLNGLCQIQLSFLDEEGCSLHNVRELPGGKQFSGTNDWTKDISEFQSPDRAKAVEVRLLVTGPGNVWFDDVKFEAVSIPEAEIRETGKKYAEDESQGETESIKKRLSQLGYLG